MKAVWNGTVIAESDDTVVVEGNHYFPAGSVKTQYLTDSPSNTVCPWKGTASYRHVMVHGQVNSDVAWLRLRDVDEGLRLIEMSLDKRMGHRPVDGDAEAGAG